MKQTIQAGWEIFNRKGNTCCGQGLSTAWIMHGISGQKAAEKETEIRQNLPDFGQNLHWH